MNSKTKSTLLLVLLIITFIICSTLVLVISFKTSEFNVVYAAEPSAASSFAGGTGTSDDPYLISTAEQLIKFRNYVNSSSSNTTACAKLIADITFTGTNNWNTPIGIMSTNYRGTFDGNYHTITGLNYQGNAVNTEFGLFGYINDGSKIVNLTLSNISFTINSSSEYSLGGLVGTMGGNSTQIENCSIVGESSVKLNNTASEGSSLFWRLGGLAGMIVHGSIKKCSNFAQVIYDQTNNVSINAQIGGLAGYLLDSSASIENSYNVGAVSAKIMSNTTSYIGGLGGRVFSGTLTKSFNYCNISYTGTSNYNSYIGGITGSNYNGPISNCYYLFDTKYKGVNTMINTSGTNSHTDDDNSKTKSLTTDQFKSQSNFDGFDFTNTWEMKANADYPTIKPAGFAANITAGNGVSVYTSTNNEATSGNSSGYLYQPNDVVYGFAVLNPGYEAPSGWTLISGSVYRVTEGTTITTQAVDLGTFSATVIVYDISYDITGGSLATANPSTYTVEDTFTLNNPTKTGYTFKGWSGTGLTGDENTSVAITEQIGDREYTANWTANTYTITYKDQDNVAFTGAHETGYPTTHTYDTVTTLKSATKTGYSLTGWYLENDCSGTAITVLGATDYTADITLYAKWTANEYTVTLNLQGGTSETTQVQATYDAAMPNITIPTKTYCGFLGYFDQETGGTKYYNADGTSAKIWDKAEDSILYAQWATGVNSVVTGIEYDWDNDAHTIASIKLYDAVNNEELTCGTLKYYDGSAYTLDNAPEYTNAGTYDIKYEYVKDGYATKYETIVLTINKSKLQITLPTAITGNVYSNTDYDLINAGSVDYGTLYYAVNATNEVPEETAFKTDIPTAKSAGTYYVFYKANGDDNHNSYVASSNEAIAVTIAKADLAEDQYTIPTGLQATYGDLLSSVTLTNGWAWKNPTNTVGNAGNAVNEAIYTPEDSVNFNTIEESLTITVSKANPTYTVPTNIEAPYGATLSTAILPDGFSWMDGTQKVNNWEANTFKAKYTPADTANYNVIENIDITVAIKWIIVDPGQETVNVEIDDGETNFDVSITVKVEVKTELSVEAKQTNYANLAKGFVAKDEDISAIYGVKLIRTTNGVEEEIQPSDIKEGQTIKISMAIPENLIGKEFRLLHIHTAEDISEVGKDKYSITADGKTLIMETDKLSEFAFVSKTDKADNGFIYDESSSGFKYWWIIVIIVVVLIICLLLFIFFKRKKDDDSNKPDEQHKVEDNITEEETIAQTEAEAEEELESSEESDVKEIEAKEKAHEAITLKDSLTLAKATSSSHTFSKKYVADYLRTKDIVEVNERENYTKTGLPLADTHYVDGKDGKKCFAYVYETEGSIILLAKMDDDYAKSLQKKHSQINKSAFPKQKNTWYSLIIDDTYTKEEFEDILDELIGEVKEDAGMSLKESIALAKASTAHSFSKKYVCEYLQDKKDVVVNTRENYTRTGLPLADTHYVIKGDKKICFAYIYEIEGSIILLAKMNTQYAKELQKKHSNVTLSAFPKQADTWYSLIIDDTYTKEDFDKIIDDIIEQA